MRHIFRHRVLEASLSDPELVSLCDQIIKSQREEIDRRSCRVCNLSRSSSVAGELLERRLPELSDWGSKFLSSFSPSAKPEDPSTSDVFTGDPTKCRGNTPQRSAI